MVMFMVFISFIAKCTQKHPRGAVVCWARRGCASRNVHQVTSNLKWRTTLERHGRILLDCIPQSSNHSVQGEIEIISEVGSFYGSMCWSSTTQLNKARTGPMSEHGTLFVCVLGVEGQSQKNVEIIYQKHLETHWASKTSSFGYSRNANFPLHKSRASILLGYVVP